LRLGGYFGFYGVTMKLYRFIFVLISLFVVSESALSDIIPVPYRNVYPQQQTREKPQ
jgi:hypothetical protein